MLDAGRAAEPGAADGAGADSRGSRRRARRRRRWPGRRSPPGRTPAATASSTSSAATPQTYLPDLALNRYEQKNAFLPPKAVNLRRGTPVWELLSAAGIGSTVLRCPCTYPPDPIRGRMLSGMGVPDLRGGLGTADVLHHRPDGARPARARTSSGSQPAADGTIATHLIGPRNPKDARRPPARDHAPPRSGRPAGRRSARPGRRRSWRSARGAGATGSGSSSRLGLLQSIRGMVRFHLVRLEPELELYASPVNFDPDAPLFPISEPPELRRRAGRARSGLFHTTGMVEDHAGLNNERIGEEAFLDQCDDAWREREAMMLHELERFDEGLFYCLFDTPDRVQHMFWRFREPDHPANRGAGPRPRVRPRSIEDAVPPRATRSSARPWSTPTTRRW